MKKFATIALLLFLTMSLSQCTTINKAREYDILQAKINHLEDTLDRERDFKNAAITQAGKEKTVLAETKDAEITRLLTEKEKLEGIRDSMIAKETQSLNLIAAKKSKITSLEEEIETLKTRNYAMNTKILTLEAQKKDQVEAVIEKETEISTLKQAQLDLEKSLKSELDSYKAKLEMTERGLVITFLAEIFFDSGKNIVREEANPTLAKVATVLNTNVPNSNVAVEGYTDNDPIRHSTWESNWELSTARALAVLHYFVNTGNVEPTRFSAVGYGEYRPVASNETEEGKQQNRRVEVVILPEKVAKVKTAE